MATPNYYKPVKREAGRRNFIATLTKVVGSTMLLSQPLMSRAANFFPPGHDTWTVGQIMDLFMKEVPGAPLPNTVDTLKAGSRDSKVTGIVTTMFATVEVIQKAIAAGANFIIAHEPTFYNHLDETAWLQQDEVYQFKADLLRQHGIAVWRNHDYIHRLVPDGVTAGVLAQLGWQQYYNPKVSPLIMLPPVNLQALIRQVKEKLNVPALRYIGDLSDTCQKVLLMPGAAGGSRQIGAIRSFHPDVLLCGEVQEWETPEYVRDARAEGRKLSLIVTGHIASEEPGSQFMAGWLKQKVPGVAVTHIPATNSFSFL